MLPFEFPRDPLRPPYVPQRLAALFSCAILLALLPAARAGAEHLPAFTGQSLALPLSAFPRRAHVQRTQPTNVQADAESGLHTLPLANLGRLDGSLQTATWNVATTSPNRSDGLTLRYLASTFATAGNAARAHGDALATLWEIGRPVQVQGISEPAFRIRQQHYIQLDLVLHRSVVELEIRVRFHSTVSEATQQAALAALQRVATLALKRVTHLTQSIPAPAPASAIPPIFVAPWGTGPIVESPSLMTMVGTASEPSVPPDPGAFRGSAKAALASRAVTSLALIPAGGLARFVSSTSDGASRSTWYNSATLYGGAAGASHAFRALVTANAKHPSAGLPPLPGADEAVEWRLDGEMVLAFRCANLITVLAGSNATPDQAIAAAGRIVTMVPTWLHARGTQIVDAQEQPVHLSALNWYGAEQQDFVVGGLDYQSYQTILNTVRTLGYNSIRLPFSDQLVTQNPIVTAHLRANPELSGLHALSILDRIISYAGAIGLRVILDNHRSDAGWSAEPNGLWYTDQYPDSTFDHDWSLMATRYAAINAVIGADLRNEPHATATWGDGNPATDWRAAAQRAGNAVLAANPHLLIIVEGIQFYGTATSAWWGSNLMGVAQAPVNLQFADGSSAHSQLVYSAHDYGPDMCGTGCPWFNSSTTYATLSAIWDQYWGYIAADPTAAYAAPVWVGEFGTCNYQQACVTDSTPGSQGQWFSSLVRYIAERRLSWAYWSVNGTQSTGGQRTYGSLDWYGLLRTDWSTPTPWLHDVLQSIQQGNPSS